MSALTHQNVNIDSIPEVEISNDSGNPVPVTGTVTTTPSGTQDVNIVSSVELEIKNDSGNPIPVNGTVNIGNFPATQNVAVTSSVEVEVKNDAGNPIPVYTSTPAMTPTVTRVSVGAGAPVTLAAADSTRKRCLIHNESGTLFVKLGTAASSTDYTYRLVANSFLDVDFIQTAAITAIKGTGTSDVQVTSVV